MASTRTSPPPSAAFTGTLEPTKTSWLYQAGLAVVALAMVLLPMIYLALIYFMARLVWWHVTNDTGIFNHVHGRGIILALLLYLAPAIAGVIFVLFLIKPLFSRGSKASKDFKLEEKDEPELFAFVYRVCELVGAPRPREVRVDCQVNASASFRRRWLSLLGNNLVLTIGLPLVAGMTTRQVAGVLAHEFGHFAQGAGMRFTFLIRNVNAWFARVVYQRDIWDERLEQWASTDDWRVQIIFKLAQGGVWLGRRVLWLLMMVGQAISGFMSRQMEFDADSYEAKLAGSDEFPRTAQRLRELNAAMRAAVDDARSGWQHHELPDDLPALVVWRESIMPDKIRKLLQDSVQEEKTHWSATHPRDLDRIAAAQALRAPGIFHLEAPANQLFTDFTALSKAVTRHFYEHDQELPVHTATFRTLAEVSADRQAADDAAKHLEAFYGETFFLSRVQPLPSSTPEAWQPSFQRMQREAASYKEMLKTYEELVVKTFRQGVGTSLVQAQFSLATPQEFGLNSSSITETQTTLRQTVDMRGNMEGAMEPYETATSQRLAAALAWLDAQPGQEEGRQRRAMILALQRPLARALKEFTNIRQGCESLKLMLSNASGHSDGIALQRHALDTAARCETALKHVLGVMGDLPHPYLPGHKPVRDSLHLAGAEDNEFMRAFKATDVCDEALLPLLNRLMGDLCGMALEAEKTLQAAPPKAAPVESSTASTAPPPLPGWLPPPTL